METKTEFVEGKVDWKGRKALKHKHGGMRASWLILGALSLEIVATLALAVNLVTYFNGVMHFELADAANQLTNFLGTCFILPILAAILADTFIGRFKTVLISASIEFLGLALLTVQAHYPKLRPPPCNVLDPTSHCEKISGGDAAFLFLGLYLLATGSAGMKASLPAHGADQFDERDSREARQMSTFFNCFFLSVCTGGMVSLTLVVWIQDNKGWDWGFGLSTIAMIVAIIIFAAGLPLYRIQIVQKSSTIIEIIQVYVAAISKRDLPLPEDPTELYELDKDGEAASEAEFLPHTDNFRFLDKAAIRKTSPVQFGGEKVLNRWALCTVTQVENSKIIIGMVPIFCCTIIMTLCLAQLQTFSIQQGLTMDTSITSSFHIPPASLPVMQTTSLIVIIPVYDQVFVPFAHKLTGHPAGITQLQRIGVGLVLFSVSMAVAAAVEVKRKAVARNHHMLDAVPVLEPLPISTFWLSFQYLIFGIADMFTNVGLLEFFYSEAPKGLKSVSTCFLWSSKALGYFFSTIMVKIVNSATKGITRSGGWLAGNNINRNHLNLFYLLLSMLSLINFFVYLIVARRYRYRTKSPVRTTPCEEVRDNNVEESN
ncbi:protein NRT1/ PTR FAMILY 4.5-like [Syzygium oleosum]|uniref:protein NRT1/ PTR FAMILY 4.5-like n=1 Tax=Syzygium oleosum TaxID=219896 RepID=UPI0024BB059C|nr:protein NRT1/ PTR FAMILY 4.5-like [Syzygium oleosum]